VLARALLARRAPTQASDALRRAIELDPGAAHAAVRIGLDQHLSAELLARAVPEGPTGTAPLQMLADYSEPGSAQRMHWLEQALARDPGSAAVHYRMALELQRDVALGDGARICRQRRDDCLRRALAHVERAAAPPSPQTSLLRALLIEQSEGSRVAEERLVVDCAPFPGDEDCARALLSLALRNQSERVPGAVRALIASGCATRVRCAATHLGLGQQFAALGQWRNAQNHFRQATQEWPTVEGWRALAQASTELGQSARAEDALRRAALLDVEKKGAQ
jgi:tetratricopeptide (TPR) repeat protein